MISEGILIGLLFVSPLLLGAVYRLWYDRGKG